MALFAVLLGFMSATQDIVIDAYRIEIAPPEQQGVLSSAYIAGYRLGMIVAGAGALFLAAHWGSARESYQYEAWQQAYLVMALAMGVGMLTTLLVREPVVAEREPSPRAHTRLLAVFLCAVLAFVGVFWGWGHWLPQWQGGPLLGLLVEACAWRLSLAAAFGVGACWCAWAWPAGSRRARPGSCRCWTSSGATAPAPPGCCWRWSACTASRTSCWG
jgi:MFS transporter, PAT family, beta-lactamase induction signal transducer AmpG